MTNDQASPCFHAAFSVVVQLVLPGVYLSWADVEAWLFFAVLAELCVYYDERFRVFGEAYERQAFVEAHFFLSPRHF